METYIYIYYNTQMPSLMENISSLSSFQSEGLQDEFPVWTEIQYVIVVWKERNKNHALKNSMPKAKKMVAFLSGV